MEIVTNTTDPFALAYRRADSVSSLEIRSDNALDVFLFQVRAVALLPAGGMAVGGSSDRLA